jgi:hypothetical protein
MFAIFGRLTRDEEMPRIEELRHRLAIMFLRIRLWMAPGRGRIRGVRGRMPARVRGRRHARARTRRPVALLFPIALVLATVTIVLVARFSGSPRCTAAAQVSAQKPLSRGKAPAKGQKPKCQAMFTPLYVR